MATLPRATTTIDAQAGALAIDDRLCCVLAPVPVSADATPRQFGSAKAIYAQHGYNEGVEYSAVHFDRTRQPILFVGLPIVTPGAISREDTSGNSGSCVTSLAAGGSGVLAEHSGVLRVPTGGGGTIGTDQIKLELSLDGGRTFKKVRLGTANSYVIPFFAVTISFGAGTLVAGDTIHTWEGSAPKSDAAGWAAARAALAAQLKLFRSALLCGDLLTDTEATALVTQFNSYETADERFTGVRASVYDRTPLASMADVSHVMTGNPNVTFAEVGATGDTITRAAGSFVTDGFAVGDILEIAGSASNNGMLLAKITGVTATVLTLDTDDLVDEGPVSNVSITGRPSLTFAGGGQTVTRAGGGAGSWLTDGFRVGDSVTISGTSSNNVTRNIVTLTATVMTLDGAGLVAEVIDTTDATVTVGMTKAAWMAAVDTEFAPVDDQKRINLSAGRGRILSPFSGWYMRRPAGWFASWREYQHDVHIASWRKDDGPVGADLFDAENNLVEWDDRVDGEAGSAARFTTLRTWANGPRGGFVALDLTRAGDASILQHQHNMNVTNVGCTTVHSATERVIGRSLIVDDAGHATADSLNTIASEVNADLERALLRNVRNEGQRASKAVWVPSSDDDFSVPEPVLTGVLELILNGTVHKVNTTVRVR